MVKHSQKGKLNLYDRVYEKLKKRYDLEVKDRYPKPSFSEFANNLLWERIEQDDLLKRYGPFLRYVGPHEGTFLIYDNKLQKPVEVQIGEKELYCKEHEGSNCIHVGFCFAIPEVYAQLELHGFKFAKSERR